MASILKKKENVFVKVVKENRNNSFICEKGENNGKILRMDKIRLQNDLSKRTRCK